MGTRKSAQTGVLHSWRLHANDIDPKMCPMRATALLALLYGEAFDPTGPVYRRVDLKTGAIIAAAPLVGTATPVKPATRH